MTANKPNTLKISSSGKMKTQQQPPKLKTQLFSCAFFRHCTQTTLSPTAASAAAASLPDRPPAAVDDYILPATRRQQQQASSSSSSSSSSSFTQWKLAPSPTLFRIDPPPPEDDVAEVFRWAADKLTSHSEQDRLAGLQALERAVVRREPPREPECPSEVMSAVVEWGLKAAPKSSSKVLLALCLAGEQNRKAAVAAGAVAAVIDMETETDTNIMTTTTMGLGSGERERAMAALELMCTVAEGAQAVRAHALAVPVMVGAMGRASPRERECAMSVLAVIYNVVGEDDDSEERAPAEEVARAVELALRTGECSARGRRKGLALLKALQDSVVAAQELSQQSANSVVV